MPKIIRNLLALCYVLLALVGLGNLYFNYFVKTWQHIIFFILLGIVIGGMIFVLREEEDEELKSN